MRKLQRLERNARLAAATRGHILGAFIPAAFRPGGASASCLRPGCSCTAYVTTRPQANEIEIGGSAVAVNCNYKNNGEPDHGQTEE